MSTATATDHRATSADPLDHQGLVGRVARCYLGRGLDYDDLVQEGYFGLRRAAELFEPGRGIRFSTYATHWILHYVRSAVRDQGNTIRVPAYLHGRRAATSPHRADAHRAMMMRRLGEGDDLTDTTSTETGALVELAEALEGLPDRVHRVLMLRFGLDGGKPRGRVAVGSMVHLGRQAVARIEAEGMARLRELLIGREKPPGFADRPEMSHH